MLDELAARYKHKIKTTETLIDAVGSFPREKRIVMCHGVFDVVHPGHLRHLVYAKSKGQYLIASITADRHIRKGKYRPHVPQELRALNLAAIDLVDYVVIDVHPTPINNLNLIRPDYFAKGYEYVSSGLNQKTSEEERCVASYGGEIIFTPGDIIYSSSRLIDFSPPEIRHDKLVNLMAANDISFDDVRSCLLAMEGKVVHVVGDTIVDTITNGAMIGGQTKTPTISVLFEKKTDFVGGAGVVAKHLQAAGATVRFSTILGEDENGEFVREDLKKFDICLDVQTDEGRPTTNKNAIVAAGYRLLKLDTLDNSSISDSKLQALCESISGFRSDAVVFSDFRHGIFNKRTIQRLVDSIPRDAFRVADSQVASRWGNITEFKEFDLITPNEREARFALADQDSGIRPLASALYDEAKCKLLVLKLGDKGILACRNSDHKSLDSFFVLDSFTKNIVDAVGAGDALLAYTTLAMLASQGNQVIATILGSLAAGVECEMDGNIPVTPTDILRKLDAVQTQAQFGDIR